MKVGAATIYYYSLNLIDSIKALARITDYIMISPIYDRISNEEIREIKEIKENLGLEFYVHGPFPNRGYDPKMDGYKIEILEETLENAYKIESDLVIIHPGRRKFYNEDTELLKQIYKISENFGITLAIENKPEDISFLKDENDFERLINDIPEIKFCIDTSHFFLWSGDSHRLSNLIRKYRERIAIFHIADAKRGEDLQMVPGYGEINWFVVGKGLKEVNLRKVPLILEAVYPAELLQGIKNFRHIIVENIIR